MKSITEQDFYELLEVAPDSSEEELRTALRRARRTWCKELGAAYSLIDDDERKEMTGRLDEAEAVLFDAARRAGYNRELGLALPPNAPAETAESEESVGETTRPRLILSPEPEEEEEPQQALFPRPAPALQSVETGQGEGAKVIGFSRKAEPGPPAAAAQPAPPPEPERAPEPKPEPAPEPPRAAEPTQPATKTAPRPDPGGFFSSDQDYTGENLRKFREECGRSLQEIARETKVSRTHLENLEAEQFSLLPAAVYVRGFLQGYCRELGLDPRAACEGYLARLRKFQSE